MIKHEYSAAALDCPVKLFPSNAWFPPSRNVRNIRCAAIVSRSYVKSTFFHKRRKRRKRRNVSSVAIESNPIFHVMPYTSGQYSVRPS